jgi:DNA polymerase III gamma/tau subunit
VLGGGEVTDETIAALFGAPRSDLQFELAASIAVRDTHGVFQIVHRLVQEGHDFRHVTGQVVAHFRDLLLVRSAPEEPAVLDVPPERHARLASQAAKFSVQELARVLSLLLAAQTDLRWTTSPRLTLELALVRATIPEADPNPSGLAARIERLERLAGLDGSAPKAAPAAPEPKLGEPAASIEAPAAATPAPEAPHAPSAGSLDLLTIRRSWQQLLDRLLDRRQMILRANLESVTPVAYDGITLELAFPPGRRFAVSKVQSKEADFGVAFAEVFGLAPRIKCVAREEVPGMAPVEEEPPSTREDAVARLKEQFGAEVEQGDESGGSP